MAGTSPAMTDYRLNLTSPSLEQRLHVAADADGLAGDCAPAWRRQKHHHVGELLRRDHFLDRRMRQRFLLNRSHRPAADLRLAAEHPPNPVAFYGAGLDRVDAYLERRKLDGKRLGETDNRPFRGGVG